MHQLNILLEISTGSWTAIAGFLLLAFILGWFTSQVFGGKRQKTLKMEKEITELKLKHQALIVESINRYESLENKYIRLQGNYTTAVNEASKLSDALVKIKELKINLDEANNKKTADNNSEKQDYPV